MTRRTPTSQTEGFVQFWEAYPKRKAKIDALKAWTRLKPTPDVVTQMLDAITWQVRSAEWRKDGGQYIPYPASWLRAGRWLDEPDAPLTTTEWVCPHEPPCLGRNACRILIVCGR